jgi:hypothetical protein
MRHRRHLMEGVLLAYRQDDLEECIRRVRLLVEAAPDVIAARYLLASLYVRAGKERLALVHYRKLLEPALERGELFRSVAIQKRIDSLEAPATPDPARWRGLLARLRGHGVPYLAAAPIGSSGPWVEGQFLSLPRAWFERVATETRVELLEAGVAEAETGTVWQVLAGRLRWSFALPDGRASGETIAAEGDAITVDPAIARRARLSFAPELPVESLRFDAPLARELQAMFATLAPSAGATPGGFTTEVRALLPTRPRPRADLETGHGPPRLELPAAGGTAPDRDPGDWVEFGVVCLGDGSAGGKPITRGGHHDADATEITLDPPGSGESPAPPAADPPAAPTADAGDPTERRRHPRAAVSFESRMALLRLEGTRLAPIHGRIFDLSPTGIGMCFPRPALSRARAALDGAVVAIELDLPGPDGPLRMAGEVRWLELDPRADEARLGLAFLLVTEPDRRRIAGALAGAPLAETRAVR